MKQILHSIMGQNTMKQENCSLELSCGLAARSSRLNLPKSENAARNCVVLYKSFIIIIIMKTLLDKVQTERVRTGLGVPCEALLQLHIQRTLHRRKYTYLQS